MHFKIERTQVFILYFSKGFQKNILALLLDIQSRHLYKMQQAIIEEPIPLTTDAFATDSVFDEDRFLSCLFPFFLDRFRNRVAGPKVFRFIKIIRGIMNRPDHSPLPQNEPRHVIIMGMNNLRANLEQVIINL